MFNIVQFGYIRGDSGADATVEKMIGYITRDQFHPAIVQIAEQLGTNSGSVLDIVHRVYEYVCNTVRYCYDNDNYVATTNDATKNVELLIAPKNFAMGVFQCGDCDDLTMYFSTLLLAAVAFARKKVQIAIKTLAWKPDHDAYTHVYALVYVPDLNVTVTADPTIGSGGLGTENPYWKRYKTRVVAGE